jgi:thiamine-monophosphate kinase
MTPLAEDEALQRIRSVLGSRIGVSGLEDDAAVLSVPPFSSLVVSVDSVVEGVHVDLDLCSPADVGWKALMGALSDLAAMGASPMGALVALCVPGGSGDGSVALGVTAGVAEAAGAAGCPVAGGDVSASSELAVVVTVLGVVHDGEPPPVVRGGANPGDALLVTGPCGGSAAGLRVLRSGPRSGSGGGVTGAAVAGVDVASYRRPVARLAEGLLARRRGATAMIDVSDGLALDLHRLADASGAGFVLDEVPVAAGATFDEALGGGEDFELVVAVGATEVDGLCESFADEGLRLPLRVGSVVADQELRVLGGQPLERSGWQHVIG